MVCEQIQEFRLDGTKDFSIRLLCERKFKNVCFCKIYKQCYGASFYLLVLAKKILF